MGTAVTTAKPGMAWHSRGTWSPREDRSAFLVWLALLWVALIAGFGVDIARFLHEAPPAPRVVDLHAFVFTGWMLLLTAQVLLVAGDRVALHRKLGWLAAGWACLMGVMGPWAAAASQSVDLHGPEYDPPFLAIQLGMVAMFLVFVAWGIALRKNPAAHKRVMILSTIALIDAGFGRFSGWIWPAEPQSRLVWFVWEFCGSVLMVALMAAWDLWRGRLMKQFAIGAAVLIAMEGFESWIYFWAPWREMTAKWVQAWARHAG